jgi:hypothetical protein
VAVTFLRVCREIASRVKTLLIIKSRDMGLKDIKSFGVVMLLLLMWQSANLGFCAVPAETLEYEAEGKVIYSGFYNLEGYAQYNQSFSFKIYSKGEDWLIRMIPESRSIQKYEHGKKGGEIYYFTKFHPDNGGRSTGEDKNMLAPAVRNAMINQLLGDTNTIEVSDSSKNSTVQGQNSATSLGGNEEGRGQSRAELISQFDKFFSSTNPIHRGKKLDGQSVKRPNDALGAIYPTIVPRPEAHYSHVVWLAFISGAYLNADKERRLPRMWNEPARSVTFKPISKWDLKDSPPYILESVKFGNNGKVEYYRDGKVSIREFAPPYEAGYLDAEYSLIQSTNISGITLPLKFSLNRYAKKKPASSAEDLRLLTSVTGVVHRIDMKCSIEKFIPELSVTTSVADYRVVGSTDPDNPRPLRYFLKKGAWRGEMEVRESDEYHNRELRSAASKKYREGLTGFRWVVVLMMGAISLVAYWYAKTNRFLVKDEEVNN